MPQDAIAMPPLFRQAFRPFFLFGSLFAFLALSLWVGGFVFGFSFQPYGHILWWHGHEMLMGFSGAIIAGFLLTAVQNWTGIAGIRGWPLAALFLLWLLARIGLAITFLPSWLIIGFDLAFFPAVALVLALPVIRIKQWRNLVFVPVLLALTLCNAMMHYAIISADHQWFVRGAYASVILVMLLITVIGGRVIPFFTARGTQSATIVNNAMLEKVVMLSTISVAIIAALDAWHWGLGIAASLIAFIAALAHLLRMAQWRPASTLAVPLLWSLHMAYLFLPIGFLLAAFYSVRIFESPSLMLHAFAVGALSGLILAMMARVSLGHSGRPLIPAKIMSLAFISISISALLRFVPPLFGYWDHYWVYLASALFWIFSFGTFLFCYTRLFLSPRADGQMG